VEKGGSFQLDGPKFTIDSNGASCGQIRCMMSIASITLHGVGYK
jgi:hypothetical protein